MAHRHLLLLLALVALTSAAKEMMPGYLAHPSAVIRKANLVAGRLPLNKPQFSMLDDEGDEFGESEWDGDSVSNGFLLAGSVFREAWRSAEQWLLDDNDKSNSLPIPTIANVSQQCELDVFLVANDIRTRRTNATWALRC